MAHDASETLEHVAASASPIGTGEDCIAFTRVGMIRDQFHNGNKIGGIVDEAFVHEMCVFSENEMMILDVLCCEHSVTPQARSDRHDKNLEHIVNFVASMQDIETLRKYIIFREAHFEVFEYLLENADWEPLVNFLFVS